MTSYTHRNITIIDYPINVMPRVYKAESIAVRFGRMGLIDIGSLCYPQRKQSPFMRRGKYVVLESFNQRRASSVKLALELTHHLSEEGKSESSAQTAIRTLVQLFNYLDEQRDVIDDPFEDYATALNAILSYNSHLKHCVLSSSLSLITATNYMGFIPQIMDHAFPDKPFDRKAYGLVSMAGVDTSSSATEPPLEEEYSNFLALMQSIFDAAYDLTVGNKSAPYKMKVPAVLGESGNQVNQLYHSHPIRKNSALDSELWDFSEDDGIASKEKQTQFYIDKFIQEGTYISGKDDPKAFRIENYICFDADGKQLHTERDAANRARGRISKARKSLEAFNDDQRDSSRVLWANKGVFAFAHLFYAFTSVNIGVTLSLKWYESHKTERASQTKLTIKSEITEKLAEESTYFRGIKGRRNYSPVEFEITSSTYNLFRKYLELRHYILNGRDSDDLFVFQAPKNKGIGFVHDSLLTAMRKQFSVHFPEIKMLSPRVLRAAKSDWLVSNVDLESTSTLLQNSTVTIEKHYIMGTQSNHYKEMGNFLSKLSNPVRSVRHSDEVESAVGSCAGFNHPSTKMKGLKVPVNCHQEEGCLFCDKYRLHADEVDVRKLYSLKYVLNQTQYLSASPDHFESIFGPVLSRIDHLISEINKTSDSIQEMVKRIYEEVFEDGELDPFWERKLNELEYLHGGE